MFKMGSKHLFLINNYFALLTLLTEIKNEIISKSVAGSMDKNGITEDDFTKLASEIGTKLGNSRTEFVDIITYTL